MAEKKYDGVIEAVRFTPEGKVQIARAYLRRGAAWGDRVLLSRQELIDQIKAGKNMVLGARVQYMAGTFDVSHPVLVKNTAGQDLLYTSQPNEGRDHLEGVPVF